MTNNTFDFYDKTSLKSYNLDVTMRYQLTMLDSLDPFTRIHSENVASITCRLCEYLRCDKNFTAYCTICAYLHDIGKMFIPAKILNKPDKLTDEEFAIMKTHTLIGYKMCMDDIKLRPYALGPKYHHETLDGMGYPEGLVGNLIPYEDQIIKVADDYDALVTKRQYKTHIHISDTLKDLIKDTEPNIKVAALDNAAQGVKLGKLNKKVVKALFKVVIDDTYYEISCVTGYVDYLKDQIKRIEQILEYEEKMDKAHSEKKKNYYGNHTKIICPSCGAEVKLSSQKAVCSYCGGVLQSDFYDWQTEKFDIYEKMGMNLRRTLQLLASVFILFVCVFLCLWLIQDTEVSLAAGVVAAILIMVGITAVIIWGKIKQEKRRGEIVRYSENYLRPEIRVFVED